LAEQTEADDRDQVSKLHFCGSNAVECDRTQGCESGFVERDLIDAIRVQSWDARDQQSRNASDFSMHGETCSRAGNAIPGLNIGYPFTDSNDRSGAAVARTLRLIQPAANRLQGGNKSIPLNFIDHVANQIGPGLSFLQ
jgi:hypothetical protein